MGGGLVNFPKYMLIHNCDLKNKDQMRYVREEAAKREAAEEEIRRRSQLGEVDQGQACGETQVSGQSSPSLKKVASWGQPMRFRTAEDRNSQWQAIQCLKVVAAARRILFGRDECLTQRRHSD